MKKHTITLSLLAAITLAACGDNKLLAHEFKDQARAQCNEMTSHLEDPLIKKQECLVAFYDANMNDLVAKNELSKADNEMKMLVSDLKRNKRTLGLQ